MSPLSTELADDETSAIEPLNRRTLHDEVVDRVRTLIVEGRLAPWGDRPVEFRSI